MEHIPGANKCMLNDGIGFVELLESFGNDLTVVNAARVSFHKESDFENREQTDQYGNTKVCKILSDRDAQLIDYLAKNRHVAPFFHPQLRFRIKMPIFVAREWYRHTVGFCRNEVSRRYVSSQPECYAPIELRQRDVSIKQGSSSLLVENNDEISQKMRHFMDQAVTFYNQLIEQGVCPEQARGILPQAMYTEFVETASLAGYARLTGLRLALNAQREIGAYAGIISQLIEPHFPVSWKALLTYKTA